MTQPSKTTGRKAAYRNGLPGGGGADDGEIVDWRPRSQASFSGSSSSIRARTRFSISSRIGRTPPMATQVTLRDGLIAHLQQ